MADVFTTVLNGIFKKFVDLGAHHAEVVVAVNADGSPIGGAGSGSNTDRELVVSTYRCKTAFTGASVGETITATQIIDVSGATPTTISTIWRNQTTAADLPSAPSAANLELTGSTALTSAQLAAAGLALEATQQQVRDRLPASMPTPGLLPVDALGTPGAARVQATSAAAANIALTPTCRRVSMYATAGTWYAISGAASTSSHFIAEGERLDFDVPASTTISVLQDSSAGSVRITELA